jgi:hypothetical protein
VIKHVHISGTEFSGVLEIVASGWDGRILKMTRDAYFKLRQSAAGLPIETVGTYILYCSYFDRSDEERRKLYTSARLRTRSSVGTLTNVKSSSRPMRCYSPLVGRG